MSAYLDRLTLYFEEEIEGEAYFAALAERFEDPDHKRKLRLLAEVERHAASGVAPLIAKYRLAPRPTEELVASGQADAAAEGLEWSALLVEMRQSCPGYVTAFEALERLGPPEDRARLSFLTAHEVAALRFLALEGKDPGASAAPLKAYLGTPPETWSPKTWRAAAEARGCV